MGECGYASCSTTCANIVVDAPPSRLDRSVYKLPFFLQQELNRYLSVGALSWRDLEAVDLRPWTVPRPGKTTTEGRSFSEFHNLLAEKMKAKGSASVSVAPPLFNVTSEAEALFDDPTCENTRVPIFRGSLTLQDRRIHFRMAPPTWDISSRFYTTFSYKRWLRVCVQTQLERKAQEPASTVQLALTEFLSRPLVIAGLSYRAVYHKDGSLFFFLEESPTFKPIFDFAFRHIDFALNAEMSLAKFIARFSLGFSKTKATIKFPSTALRFVPDVTSTSLPIGRTFMHNVATSLMLPYLPSAVRMTTKDGAIEVIYVLDQTQARGDFSDWITITSDMLTTRGSTKTFQPTFSAKSIREEGNVVSDISCTMTYDAVRDKARLKLQAGTWSGVGEVMTDGNAAISRSAMIGVAEVLGLAEVPSAVQARIGGSKGVWYIDHHLDTSHEEPWIEIRESQHKYNERPHFSYVLEVVRWSAPGSTAQIGKQMLQVLADRGVPNEVFTQLLSSAMQEKLEELLNWDNPSALRRAVEIAGRVKHNRSKLPAAAPDATVLLRSGSFNSSNDEDVDLRRETSSAGTDDSTLAGDEGYDLYSGMPKSAAEIVIEMIDAGFAPNNNLYMANKIKTIIESVIDGMTKFRIPVAKSTTLYVMVDPVGVLAPDEIYVQLSDGIVDPGTRQKIRIITGDVLVTRSPCVLPSDIRKVTAVDKLELRTYQDVVVFPRNGHRPLCGLLGGGDYDGDTICLVFEPSVVNAFTDAPESLADAPFDTSDYFTSDSRSVEEVVLPLHEKDNASLHQLLLAPLFAPRHYGMLSEMHTTCIYTKGLSDPATVELAHLFAIALDSAKSGKCLRADKASHLRYRFNTTSKPAWTLKVDKSEAALDCWVNQKKDNAKAARRGRGLQEHVMDALAKMGEEVKVKHKGEITQRVDDCERLLDLHLSAPWTEYVALAREDADLKHDLQLIEGHIKDMSKRFKDASTIIAKGKNTPSTAMGSLHIGSTFVAWQAAMQALRVDFVIRPPNNDLKSSIFRLVPDAHRRLRTLKASAAYTILFRELAAYPSFGHRLNMPYSLAFRDLLALKADAGAEESARKMIGPASRGITAPRIIRPIWLDLATRRPPQKKRRLSPTV